MEGKDSCGSRVKKGRIGGEFYASHTISKFISLKINHLLIIFRYYVGISFLVKYLILALQPRSEKGSTEKPPKQPKKLLKLAQKSLEE